MNLLYVSCMGDDLVVVFRVDTHTGELRQIDEVVVPGGPAPLATDASNRWLFVGRRTDNHLASYSRDTETGCLSLINSVSLEADPCYLATDRSGRFLFSAYYGAGLVAVHHVEADGSISPTPIQWRETAKRAHCMQADPANKFVFVPHIAEKGGANAISQFCFDDSTGKLRASSPERITPPILDGPRHFCFHPSLALVYCSNEQSSSVGVYSFDTMLGTLAPLQSVSNLPHGFADENTCSQIQVTPCGRFLYAPNRGHDSIAIFAIDQCTGRLSARGHQTTEKTPRAFSIDTTGRFLFVAGLDSGRLAAYRIDQETGALDLLDVYVVGREPMWVLAG